MGECPLHCEWVLGNLAMLRVVTLPWQVRRAESFALHPLLTPRPPLGALMILLGLM